MKDMVTEGLSEADSFALWFGEFSTAPRSDLVDWGPEVAVSAQDVQTLAGCGAWLERNPASRFSFIRHEAGHVTLFVDGTSYPCSGAVAEFAEQLCANNRLAIDAVTVDGPISAGLIADLANRGSVALSDGA
jgi:50S ribosomal protein L16 3-hydroxylase